METFLTQEELFPMRMVLPLCSSGGLAATSSTLFDPFPKIDQPPGVTLPWMCTLPSALPRISTLPELLLTSSRTGAETENVRSNVALSTGVVGEAKALPTANRRSPGTRVSWRVFSKSFEPVGTGPPKGRYADQLPDVPEVLRRGSLSEPCR